MTTTTTTTTTTKKTRPDPNTYLLLPACVRDPDLSRPLVGVYVTLTPAFRAMVEIARARFRLLVACCPDAEALTFRDGAASYVRTCKEGVLTGPMRQDLDVLESVTLDRPFRLGECAYIPTKHKLVYVGAHGLWWSAAYARREHLSIESVHLSWADGGFTP